MVAEKKVAKKAVKPKATKETKDTAALSPKAVPAAGKKKVKAEKKEEKPAEPKKIVVESSAPKKTGLGAFGGGAKATSLADAFSAKAVKGVDVTKLFEKREPVVVKQPEVEKPKVDDDAKKIKGKPTRSQRKSHLNQPLDKEECTRTIFVGNLPNDANQKQLRKIFADCGDIESCRVRNIRLKPDDRRVDRGRAVRCLRGELQEGDGLSANGFVVFKEKSAVDAALKKSGSVHLDRHVTVTREDPQSKAFTPATSGFLGNLAYTVGDEEIWRFFIDNGVKDVERVRIIRDRETGVGKGIGYVQFKSPQTLANAIGLRGKELHGRELRMTHVQKIKNDAIANEASRREKRRRKQDEQLQTQAPQPQQPKLKKRKMEEDEGHKTSGRRAAAQTTQASETEEVPAWMGATANPRKKLSRDLRPLTQSAEDRKKMLREKKRAAFASRGKSDEPGHKSTKSGPQPRKPAKK